MVERGTSPRQRVEVALFGFVRDVTTKGRLNIELPPGATLRALLEALGAVQGEALRQRLLTADGQFQPGVQVFAGHQRLYDLDDRLALDPRLPIKILVLNAAAGG